LAITLNRVNLDTLKFLTMRKVSLLIVALFTLTASFATSRPASAPLKASAILLPVGNTGKTISLLDLSEISVKEFQKITGKKMSFADRMGFKLAQRNLRNSINNDGTVNNKKLTKMVTKADGTSGFHIGGFALGFLLGLIGVLIAYLINDDKKKNRVKWAWLGLLAWVVIVLVFFII
jgi:hypothetical protein